MKRGNSCNRKCNPQNMRKCLQMNGCNGVTGVEDNNGGEH
jgi:hypothetical protein